MKVTDVRIDRFHVLVDAVAAISPKRAAEIGVRHGETAHHLLDKFPALHLTLVDPYPEYIEHTGQVYTKDLQEEIKRKAQLRLLPYFNRTRWLCTTSFILEPTLKAEGIVYDFVFIDGNHSYEFVKEDIRIWYPNVRAGGVLCGHDYNMEGVGKAVREFATEQNKDILHYANPDVDVWAIYL